MNDQFGATPGPWKVIKPFTYGNSTFFIETESSEDRRVVIAELKYNADGNQGNNARIMAIAPQLVEISKLIVENYSPKISYCEFCYKHAPKDDDGVLCGDIEHEDDCPIKLLSALLDTLDERG